MAAIRGRYRKVCCGGLVARFECVTGHHAVYKIVRGIETSKVFFDGFRMQEVALYYANARKISGQTIPSWVTNQHGYLVPKRNKPRNKSATNVACSPGHEYAHHVVPSEEDRGSAVNAQA
jgi:hypothetical protein